MTNRKLISITAVAMVRMTTYHFKSLTFKTTLLAGYSTGIISISMLLKSSLLPCGTNIKEKERSWLSSCFFFLHNLVLYIFTPSGMLKFGISTRYTRLLRSTVRSISSDNFCQYKHVYYILYLWAALCKNLLLYTFKQE